MKKQFLIMGLCLPFLLNASVQYNANMQDLKESMENLILQQDNRERQVDKLTNEVVKNNRLINSLLEEKKIIDEENKAKLEKEKGAKKIEEFEAKKKKDAQKIKDQAFLDLLKDNEKLNSQIAILNGGLSIPEYDNRHLGVAEQLKNKNKLEPLLKELNVDKYDNIFPKEGLLRNLNDLISDVNKTTILNPVAVQTVVDETKSDDDNRTQYETPLTQYQAQVKEFENKIKDYEDEINRLKGRDTALQAQINELQKALKKIQDCCSLNERNLK